MFTTRTRRPSRNAKPVRRPSIRLHMDQLEVRAVPATIAWDGGPTGMGTNWLDPVNWVGDVLPGPNDDAVVGEGSEITLAGNASVHSASVARTLRVTEGALTIGTGESQFFPGLVLDGGTLNPLSGASIVLSRIYGPGILTNPAGVTLTMAGNEILTPFINNGTFVVTDSAFFVNVDVTNAADGTIRIPNEHPTEGGGGYLGQLYVQGNLVNDGLIQVSSGSTGVGLIYHDIQVAGRLTNASDGIITVTDTWHNDYKTDLIEANIDNSGTINIDAGARLEWDSRNSTNPGTINVAGQLELLTYGPTQADPSITSTGVVSIAAGGHCGVNNFRYDGGSITGAGSFAAGYGSTQGAWGCRFDVDYTVSVANFVIVRSTYGPGTLTNPVGNTITFSGGANFGPLMNQGTVLVSSGGISGYDHGANSAGNFINSTGATLLINGTAYCESDYTIPGYGAAVTNQGVIEITNGATFVSDGCRIVNAPGGRITNSGTIDLSGGNMTLDQSAGGATFTNAGSVFVPSPRTFTFIGGLINTGTLTGAGTVIGAITGGGTISPRAYSGPVGILTVNGSITGTGLTVDLNGTTAGTNYDQLKVNGTLGLGGPLALSLGYTPAIGDTFRIIDNDGADPINGNFTGLAEGAILTINGMFFQIVYVGGTGNDVTLTRVSSAAPTAQVVVGDGTAQRSRVTQLKVVFDRIINYLGQPGTAFELQKIVGGVSAGDVGFSVTTVTVGSHSEATLTLTSDTTFGSLNDGRYRLVVIGAQIVSNGTPMDSNVVTDFHRMYGDANGDGIVNGADLSLFASTFGKKAGDVGYLSYFDYNGDGVINGFDLGQFRVRYGTSLP